MSSMKEVPTTMKPENVTISFVASSRAGFISVSGLDPSVGEVCHRTRPLDSADVSLIMSSKAIRKLVLRVLVQKPVDGI